MAYQDAELDPILGELLSVVSGEEILGTLTEMFGTLSATAFAHERINSEAITMVGTLDGSVQTVMYIDAYAAMYGFLTAEVSSSELKSVVLCPDVEVNFETSKIDVDGCILGETSNIIRAVDDTYPIQVKLGRNGNYSTTGITFKMSTQIAGEIVYTSTGTVLNADEGLVEFQFASGAIGTAGSGEYDIQGDDGYIYTYTKGAFVLLSESELTSGYHDITKYRGDNYPLQVKLGKDDNYNITGMTFEMSTRIAEGTTYISTGNIIDANKGLVSFPFVSGAVDTAGSGVYSIRGNNGYIFTYTRRNFVLLDDLTP